MDDFKFFRLDQKSSIVRGSETGDDQSHDMFTVIVALRRCEILEKSAPLRVIIPGLVLSKEHQMESAGPALNKTQFSSADHP